MNTSPRRLRQKLAPLAEVGAIRPFTRGEDNLPWELELRPIGSVSR